MHLQAYYSIHADLLESPERDWFDETARQIRRELDLKRPAATDDSLDELAKVPTYSSAKRQHEKAVKAWFRENVAAIENAWPGDCPEWLSLFGTAVGIYGEARYTAYPRLVARCLLERIEPVNQTGLPAFLVAEFVYRFRREGVARRMRRVAG